VIALPQAHAAEKAVHSDFAESPASKMAGGALQRSRYGGVGSAAGAGAWAAVLAGTGSVCDGGFWVS